MEDAPVVSVVLPVRNEGERLAPGLMRFLRQDYPAERLEILVVDGRSEDDTREVVRRVQRELPGGERIHLLDNPGRTVPPALNVGIRRARGEVIVRFDGHSVAEPDYVRRAVEALRASGAANVGGIMHARGETPFGRAVAAATGHPLAVGGAKYRTGGAGEVDTVPYGAFRRDAFVRVGLFDESMVRNQDAEFNVRLRGAGQRVVLDPSIRFTYTPRGTPGALWRQYFQYGWWRVETLRRHPRSLRLRQTAPPAYLAFVASSLVASAWLPALGWLAAGAVALHGATVVSVAATLGRRHPDAGPGRVASALGIVHLAWGSGFLTNLLSGGRWPYRAGSPRVPTLSPERTADEAVTASQRAPIASR